MKSRIFQEFNNAGIDVPTAMTGDVNQNQSANRILNPDYNPTNNKETQ